MHLIMDDAEHATDARSITEAIECGAQVAEKTGRCVVEVHVDGAQLTQSEISSTDRCAQTANEVRLVTARPQELVQDVLQDAVRTLDHIDSLQREAAEFIHCDQIVDAMRLLDEAISAWIDVQNAASKSAVMAGIDLATFETDQVEASIAIEHLNRHLNSIARSLRSNDPVTLSDTLLYELPDTITDWKHILATISDQLAA